MLFLMRLVLFFTLSLYWLQKILCWALPLELLSFTQAIFIDIFFSCSLGFVFWKSKSSNLKIGEQIAHSVGHFVLKKEELSTWIKFLSLVPYEILLFSFSLEDTSWQLLAILRMGPLFIWAERVFHQPSLSNKSKALIALYFFALFVHLVTCGWIKIYPQENMDMLSQYIQAMYWSITTLTTIGYGDMTPTDNLGRVFTMGVMLSGVAMYSLVIGNVSGMILSASKHHEEVKEKIKDLADFMSYYAIPENKRDEVFTYVHHMVQQRLSSDDLKIISDLPQALQADLKVYMIMRSIREVSIFRDCSDECLMAIGEKLQEVCFSPAQSIIRQGEDGNEMYIVCHGELDVIEAKDETVLATLSRGQVFGEMALVETEKRVASVRAKTYCDLFLLSKEDFLEIHQRFPEIQRNVAKVIEKRKVDSVNS